MKDTLNEDIKSLVSKVCAKWDFYKSKEEIIHEGTYSGSEVKTLNGYTTCWNNPKILWLLIHSEDGSYDGSGEQIGLTIDGKFVWEYQSHCSCNGFEDSSGNGDGELALDFDTTKKSYELRNLPDDWKKIVKFNLEEILKIK